MTKEIISVKNLRVAYGDYVLFDDINFSVNEKDVFIIMGASGCGKSSMLRVLTGLLPPKKGNVIIKGTDITLASDEEIQKILRRTEGICPSRLGNYSGYRIHRRGRRIYRPGK